MSEPRWAETTSGGDRTCDDCQRTINMGELWYCAEWRNPGTPIWHRCTNCRALYGESFQHHHIPPATDEESDVSPQHRRTGDPR